MHLISEHIATRPIVHLTTLPSVVHKVGVDIYRRIVPMITGVVSLAPTEGVCNLLEVVPRGVLASP